MLLVWWIALSVSRIEFRLHERAPKLHLRRTIQLEDEHRDTSYVSEGYDGRPIEGEVVRPFLGSWIEQGD